ncbi:MAG TPA: helix-turn-helix transcriptional regulator [Epulopiscium sp.]|nr:helix-turn-helix transcriptional regulator [Candidatus Epulonipiscium sp.]
MNFKTMGDLILKLRKEQNMTQKELADQLNITDKAVSKWERGLTCPDINTIPMLAKTLGITSEELLNIEQTPNTISLNKKEEIKNMMELIFKAVALGMGVATFVLSMLGDLKTEDAITFLSIGLIALAINALKK